MADFTLLQAIALLEGLPYKVGQAGEEIMKAEFGNNRKYATGKTYASIHHEVLSSDLVFIGTDSENAHLVLKGRGAVRPKRAKWLRWKEPERPMKDGYVFAKYSSPVKPDDFVGRTAKRLMNMSFL